MTKKIKVTLIFLGILFVLFAGVLMVMYENWNLMPLWSNLSSQGIIGIALSLGALCLGILLLSAFSRLKRNTKKYSFLYTIVSIITLFILMIFIMLCLFWGFGSEPKYYVFQSPDQQHTIVVEERSFLLAGSGTFYLKENALFMKPVEGYRTDDGYRPFQQKDFQLKWKRDSVSITYGFGNLDIQKEVTIPF